jgi:HD-like signal output (HDOD) protein
MLGLGILIAGLLSLGAWLVRRRLQATVLPVSSGSASPPIAVGGTAAVPATARAGIDAPRVDAARVARENILVTGRLWRLAFAAPREAPPMDAAHAPVRESIFCLLRANSIDQRCLPRRPTLMPQLLRAIEDRSAAPEKLSRMIGLDPVLTADVLRLANSSLYRKSPAPIESIQRAIAVLGVDTLRGVLATAMLQPAFRATRKNFPRFPRLLWERTERVARAAELYAQLTIPGDRFEAQLVALLSALGPLTVYSTSLDVYAQAPGLAPNPSLCAELTAALGAQMSLRIARQWQASARILAALETQADEPLSGVLAVGELLGTLALLESQTVIAPGERLESARSAGLECQWAGDIFARLVAAA